MFKRTRKGQAALEFLTTYGWAFMVILVMIGALAYFGVLNPQNLIPDQCAITSGFTCADFIVTTSGVNLSGVSSMGQSVNISGFNVSKAGVGGSCTSATATGSVADGSSFSLGCSNIPTLWDLKVKSKAKLGFSFQYVKLGISGAFPHTVTGTMTATVQ